jgi:hypothetical protein
MLPIQKLERKELTYAISQLQEVVSEVEMDMEVESGEGQKFRLDDQTIHKLTWTRVSTDSNMEWTIKINMSTDVFWCSGEEEAVMHEREFEPARLAQAPSQRREHSVWIPNFGDPDIIEE